MGRRSGHRVSTGELLSEQKERRARKVSHECATEPMNRKTSTQEFDMLLDGRIKD